MRDILQEGLSAKGFRVADMSLKDAEKLKTFGKKSLSEAADMFIDSLIVKGTTACIKYYVPNIRSFISYFPPTEKTFSLTGGNKRIFFKFGKKKIPASSTSSKKSVFGNVSTRLVCEMTGEVSGEDFREYVRDSVKKRKKRKKKPLYDFGETVDMDEALVRGKKHRRKNSTVKTVHAAVSAFLHYVGAPGLLDLKPQLKTRKKVVVVLSETQVKGFVDFVAKDLPEKILRTVPRETMVAFLRLAFTTGMRIREILDLDPSAFRPPEGGGGKWTLSVVNTKTSVDREVFVDAGLAVEVRKLLAKNKSEYEAERKREADLEKKAREKEREDELGKEGKLTWGVGEGGIGRWTRKRAKVPEPKPEEEKKKKGKERRKKKVEEVKVIIPGGSIKDAVKKALAEPTSFWGTDYKRVYDVFVRSAKAYSETVDPSFPKVAPYVSRRTFQTILHRRGVAVVPGSKYVGNSPETMMKFYIAVEERDMERIKEVIEDVLRV